MRSNAHGKEVLPRLRASLLSITSWLLQLPPPLLQMRRNQDPSRWPWDFSSSWRSFLVSPCWDWDTQIWSVLAFCIHNTPSSSRLWTFFFSLEFFQTKCFLNLPFCLCMARIFLEIKESSSFMLFFTRQISFVWWISLFSSRYNVELTALKMGLFVYLSSSAPKESFFLLSNCP